LEAAVDPRHFGVVWVAFAAALGGLRTYGDRRTVLLSVVVLAYMGLYVSHARHHWFVGGQEVRPEEMVRYLYPIAAPACLVVARILSGALAGLAHRPTWGQRRVAALVAAIGITSVIVAVPTALETKRAMAADEAALWRQSLPTIGLVENRDKAFVSSRTAALYAYAGKDVVLIDFIALGDSRLSGLLGKLNLGGHLKTGQSWTGQNRPVGERPKHECSTPSPRESASPRRPAAS